MAMIYQPIEADYLKAQRMDREPGVDLVRCDDGLWRTEEEKKAYDSAAPLTLTNGDGGIV